MIYLHDFSISCGFYFRENVMFLENKSVTEFSEFKLKVISVLKGFLNLQ